MIHDPNYPDVNPVTGDEAETSVRRPDRRDDPTEKRRRVSVRISTAVADRADREARHLNTGVELVYELALHTYLDIVDRDRANPRPADVFAEHTHPFDVDST